MSPAQIILRINEMQGILEQDIFSVPIPEGANSLSTILDFLPSNILEIEQENLRNCVMIRQSSAIFMQNINCQNPVTIGVHKINRHDEIQLYPGDTVQIGSLSLLLTSPDIKQPEMCSLEHNGNEHTHFELTDLALDQQSAIGTASAASHFSKSLVEQSFDELHQHDAMLAFNDAYANKSAAMAAVRQNEANIDTQTVAANPVLDSNAEVLLNDVSDQDFEKELFNDLNDQFLQVIADPTLLDYDTHWNHNEISKTEQMDGMQELIQQTDANSSIYDYITQEELLHNFICAEDGELPELLCPEPVENVMLLFAPSHQQKGEQDYSLLEQAGVKVLDASLNQTLVPKRTPEITIKEYRQISIGSILKLFNFKSK